MFFNLQRSDGLFFSPLSEFKALDHSRTLLVHVANKARQIEVLIVRQKYYDNEVFRLLSDANFHLIDPNV